MKLTCDRNKFAQLFLLVASVTSMRDVKPVLMNVKIIAESNKIVLMATNTEVGIRAELTETVEIQEPGEAILSTKMFSSILSLNKGTRFILETREDSLNVQMDSEYVFPTQAAVEFPNIESYNSEKYHQIAAKSFHDMIRRTDFAIDQENSRYQLSSILFEFTDNRAASVATDGRRLAYQEVSAESCGGHISENISLFSPRALSIFDKAIGDKETIKIFVGEEKAILIADNITVHAQLVEGRFPRWRNIIPALDGKCQVDLIVGSLLTAANQVSPITTDKEPAVIFRFSRDRLEISANTSEKGKARVELPIVFDHDEVEVKIDPKFVIQFLSKLEPDRIVTAYFSEGSTILFKTDDGYSYVVMPLA